MWPNVTNLYIKASSNSLLFVFMIQIMASKGSLSKEDYLKRYLSKPKGKKGKSEETVHYIR